MTKLPTAQAEILKRIKALDAEEDTYRRKAGNLLAEAARAEAKADALATVRRQYEFAYTQLGGEVPQPSTAVEIPVNRSGRLIGQLG